MTENPLTAAEDSAIAAAVDALAERVKEVRQAAARSMREAELALEEAMARGVQHVERMRQSVDDGVERLTPVLEAAVARGVERVDRVRRAVDDGVEGAVARMRQQVDGHLDATLASLRPGPTGWLRRAAGSLLAWFDTRPRDIPEADLDRIDWLRVLPFLGVHVACLGVFFVPFSGYALAFGVALYLIRMHAITGWYHRYFSHKAFRTSRFYQFLWAVIGATSAQRGPIWWAAHHRHHHRHSDTPADLHSPRHKGFWMAHMGWFMTGRGFQTRAESVPDLTRFPELRFIDRFDLLFPFSLGAACFFGGGLLASLWPELGITAGNLLFWGFFVSTVALFHGTVTINSLSHVWGSRRYATRDDSRNNPLLALITLGEGWHNNHHHYPGSARQGFYWWEVDVSYCLLKLQGWLGLVRDLKPVPPQVLGARRVRGARTRRPD